jgi:hypothetical protein
MLSEGEKKEKEEKKGRKSPHTAATAYPRALCTVKDSPSEPLRNPPSYARKLPVFTDLSLLVKYQYKYIDMKM